MHDIPLETLGFIALYKSMLPFRLRGWVSALGLHVQERRAGDLERLMGGGRFRTCLDVRRLKGGEWEVAKFDIETWERRFAHLVEPTCNIADYLSRHGAEDGELDSRKSATLKDSIDHFKLTGGWRWLPGIPVDLKEVSRQFAELEPSDLAKEVAHAWSRRAGSEVPGDWLYLGMLYDLAERYKEMEEAIEASYYYASSGSETPGWRCWRSRRTLGDFYFAAFSNSTGAPEVLVVGSAPSRVTADSLGYSVDEVRALAEKHFRRALADAEGAKAEGLPPDDSELE